MTGCNASAVASSKDAAERSKLPHLADLSLALTEAYESVVAEAVASNGSELRVTNSARDRICALRSALRIRPELISGGTSRQGNAATASLMMASGDASAPFRLQAKHS